MENEYMQSALVFATNSPILSLGTDLIATNYVVICNDDSELVDKLLEEGVNVFSLDRFTGERGTVTRNSFDLLSHPAVEIYLSKFTNIYLTVFKNSAEIEKLCLSKGWNLLAPKSIISRKYENKTYFPTVLDELGIKHPPTITAKAGQASFLSIKEKFSLPFVLQFAKGFAGRETFLVTSQEEFSKAVQGKQFRDIKATKFIHGETITINACVNDFGVLVSNPFYQITGLPTLTPFKLGSCGQDWGFLPIDSSVIDNIVCITEKIGTYIGSKGFRGIFGIDFVVEQSSNEVNVIEINPRLVASVPVFTELQIINNEMPLVAWHLQSFGFEMPNLFRIRTNLNYSLEDFEDTKKLLRNPKQGSQLILHNIESIRQVITGEVKAGFYRIKNGDLEFLRESIHLYEITSLEEFLILPASKGQIINPGIECARVQFGCASLKSSNTLNDLASNASKLVYDKLKLIPA